MYKILIKYNSVLGREFYQMYQIQTEGSLLELIEYSTDDLDELKNTIKELDREYGYKNIRVIKDVTYNVGVTVDEIKVDAIEPNPSEP
ncbi:Uncharacterised protein [uncultured Coprococcus sp.]|jgi:hypothetical protein|uniref:hypothetical protein n=1 Tax=Coprococcus ammoniilyticus TaxID=2981785 RepID=UPI0008224176|nr:hypothetical protein [Coprococcus ammoniilyticus]MCU6731129.1 hypothetical protein [Coprococcus ammoniilyticus]SCH95187.1 Uncharacterised protein [uncultured Coprococcus sp.]